MSMKLGLVHERTNTERGCFVKDLLKMTVRYEREEIGGSGGNLIWSSFMNIIIIKWRRIKLAGE